MQDMQDRRTAGLTCTFSVWLLGVKNIDGLYVSKVPVYETEI